MRFIFSTDGKKLVIDGEGLEVMLIDPCNKFSLLMDPKDFDISFARFIFKRKKEDTNG